MKSKKAVEWTMGQLATILLVVAVAVIALIIIALYIGPKIMSTLGMI